MAIEKISSILLKSYDLEWSKLSLLECGAGPLGEEIGSLDTNENCYYIEPVKEYFETLLKTKNVKNVFNFALSDKIGESDFLQTTHPGNGSLSHSSEHIKELINYGSSFTSIKTKTITYMEFLSLIGKKINILVLDVEGHEINILKTIANLNDNEKPEIIVIECGYDWEERHKLLNKINYKLDFYYYNNAYLSLSNIDFKKNESFIKEIKKQWKSWSWNGKLIYNDTNI